MYDSHRGDCYVDEVLMQVTGTTKRYLHGNHLYSVAAVTDTSGNVVERYRYDAYGKRTVLDANGLAKSGNGVTSVAFTGRTIDDETGLMYFRARQYSVTLGRFVGRDPIRSNYWRPIAGDGYVDGPILYSAWFVPGMLDPYGTKAGKEDGAKQIRDSADKLKKECECCVEAGQVSLCKQEAGQVTEEMAKIWENNWGKGAKNDDTPGSDSVGGYMCWDWANAFQDAAESVKATIWGNSFQKFRTPYLGKWAVHYAVKIEITNAKPQGGKTCDGFSFDDGFMDGNMVHGTPCEANKQFPSPTSAYEPVPPGKSTDPSDFGHPPVIPLSQ